jgi:homocysteine S-methyltransferase
MTMARYRNNLPQLSGKPFLTDGGVETTLYFLKGIELPEMAAFALLRDQQHSAVARDCLAEYARVAVEHGVGVILETLTWRANPDWARKLGYSSDELAALNRQAVEMVRGIRDELANDRTEVVISGNLGPRGDGYDPSRQMTAPEAQDYHAEQIETFRDTEADMISALTLNYLDEAIGIARAAKAAGMPHVLSFTVETDGALPTGDSLQSTIERVDEATGGSPLYYMINCAHPSHFDGALREGAAWTDRIRGLRANSSSKSHAELDESPTLDEGDPADLARRYRELLQRFPKINVLGGCCGTNHRHVGAIAAACL